MNVRALPIYPYPPDPDALETLRRAFMRCGFDFQVQPSPAVPGSPGRVLSLTTEGWPPFICTFASPDIFRTPEEALQWIFDEGQPETLGRTPLDYLRGIFGEGVREVTDEREGVYFE